MVAVLLVAAACRSSVPRDQLPRFIAVLPFQALGSDRSSDFLRIALPDEIVTTLSRSPSLAIRPFASARKYDKPDADPQTAGKDLGVDRVLTGHYIREGDRLQVTLEVMATGDNRIVWRDTFDGERATLSGSGSASPPGWPTACCRCSAPAAAPRAPRSRESGGLRPLPPEHGDLPGPAPNKTAIPLLERSVALDASYAPAWSALADRYYFDGTYADGGQRALDRAREHSERALSLDPNLESASSRLILLRVEGGDLDTAYDQAADFARRQPDSAEAHFTLGTCCATRVCSRIRPECEAARGSTRGTAAAILWSDVHSARSVRQRPQFLRARRRLPARAEHVRYPDAPSGKRKEAIDAIRTRGHSRDAVACMTVRPARKSEPGPRGGGGRDDSRDSEPKYNVGAALALCARPTWRRASEDAVEQKSCAGRPWTTTRPTPLYAPARVRVDPQAGSTAKRFVAHRDAAKPR